MKYKKIEKKVVEVSLVSAALLECVQWDHKELDKQELKSKIKELEDKISDLKQEVENDSCG